MHTRETENARCSGPESNRPLPARLAKSLQPEIRLALMHGARRRILRTLDQDPPPRTIQDLHKTLPGLSISSINYHVLVLGKCDCLTVSLVNATPRSCTRRLASNAADDSKLVEVLRATEALDDVR